MNTSERDDDTYGDTRRNTLAAIFDSRDAAHDAARRLHDEGFHGTWIGLTRPQRDEAGGDPYTGATTATAAENTMVKAENWFQRMFGEGDETLHDALIKHGVRDSDLRDAGPVPPGSAILTVDGSNHPEAAAQIIDECGGDLITSGATDRGYAFDHAGTRGDATMNAATMAGAGTLDASSDRYRDRDYTGYGNYRGGEQLDEQRRIQLREERLNVNKERVAGGEATVRTEVVSQQQSIDVPVTHEELYIERRPASGTVDAGPIGEGQTIRVPLSEERVTVTKTPVVTEEIVVGKREVSDTQHINETTRKEQLRDGGTTVGARAGSPRGSGVDTRDDDDRLIDNGL